MPRRASKRKRKEAAARVGRAKRPRPSAQDTAADLLSDDLLGRFGDGDIACVLPGGRGKAEGAIPPPGAAPETSGADKGSRRREKAERRKLQQIEAKRERAAQ
ncbi:unnamed protein product, partial [Ostreobium quekettii]